MAGDAAAADRPLRGLHAAVTGASRGLGRAFAEALAAAGASLTLLARSAETLEEAARAIGPGANAEALDVTDARAVLERFKALPPVDVLVNNAGVLGPIGPFHEADLDEWWRAMEVNVHGAMACTRAVLPGMLERRRGRIINLVTGAFAPAHLSAYLASKTALIRATECVANETRGSGVALFSAAPGTIQTDMTSHSRRSADGQRWIPWFRRIFDERLNVPAERPARLIVELASGRRDRLSGLYLTPFDDLDAIERELPAVDAERLYSLRVRTLGGTASGPLADIRNAAERPAR